MKKTVFIMLLLITVLICGCSSDKNTSSLEDSSIEEQELPSFDWADEPEDSRMQLTKIVIAAENVPPPDSFVGKIIEDLAYSHINILEYNQPVSDEKTLLKLNTLCGAFGVKYILTDTAIKDGFLGNTDAEIKEIVEKYSKNKPFVGFYLDSCCETATKYNSVYSRVAEYMPDIICKAVMPDCPDNYDDFRGELEEVASATDMRYIMLSIDLLSESAVQQLEIARQIGLKYGKDIAVRIKALGQDAATIRYQLSLALAYNCKYLSYDAWVAPEGFTEPTIYTSQYKRSINFKEIGIMNARICSCSDFLRDSDVFTVYDKTSVPADFFLKPEDEKYAPDLMYSLMKNKKDGRNYIMITYTGESKYEYIYFNTTLQLVDLTGGVELALERERFYSYLESGSFVLLALPKDVDLAPVNTVSEDNLAKNKPVYTESSVCSDGFYSYKAVDGMTDGKGFKTVSPASLTIDLGALADINSIEVYPCESEFPNAFSLSVSSDGDVFTTVGSYTHSETEEDFYSFDFDTADSRFVRLTITDIAGSSAAIGEIKVFNKPQPDVSEASAISDDSEKQI